MIDLMGDLAKYPATNGSCFGAIHPTTACARSPGANRPYQTNTTKFCPPVCVWFRHCLGLFANDSQHPGLQALQRFRRKSTPIAVPWEKARKGLGCAAALSCQPRRLLAGHAPDAGGFLPGVATDGPRRLRRRCARPCPTRPHLWPPKSGRAEGAFRKRAFSACAKSAPMCSTST